MFRLRFFPIWLLAAVLLFISGASAQTPFRLNLRVDPDILPANGISTATITVVVYDSAGFRVDDGTPVQFSTTLGSIEPQTAMLMNRTARVTLRSANTSGVARISAVVGPGHAERDVEFVDSDAYARSSRYISVAARHRDTYLAYGVDSQVITTSGDAEWRFGAISVHADVKTDFDLLTQVLFAEGTPGKNHVVISNGKQTLEGDQLIYNAQRRRGTLLAVSPEATRIIFSGIELKPAASEEGGEEQDVVAPKYTLSGYWITAQRMIVYPQDKIQFHKAAIHLQGKRLMSWPHYVLPLNGVTTSDILGINTIGGLSLDMPFYYRANPSGTGALRLRHFGDDGFYSDATGWSLGLDEEYRLGRNGEGWLAVDQLLRKDWGLSWQHQHQFSPSTQASVFVDYPFHENLFTRLSLYKDTKAGHLGVETFATRPSQGSATLFTQAFFQTPARRLSKSLSYNTSFNTFYSRNPDSPQGNVVGESVNLTLYPRTIALSKSTDLSGSFRTNLFNDSNGQRGVAFGMNWNLYHRFSNATRASLGYSYDGGGVSSFGLGRLSSSHVNFQIGSYGKKWRANAYLTRDLKNEFFYGSGFLSYQLNPLWRIRVGAYQSQFLNSSFNDLEISVGRVIFQRELIVAWSKSRNKIYFELGGWEF